MTPPDARAALIAELRAINPGFDGCVAGHKLALRAAEMLAADAERISDLERNQRFLRSGPQYD